MVKNPPANAGGCGLIPGSGRSLEEGTATHSRILAWRIPWTEEPGGLQSTSSHRVRHDLITKHSFPHSSVGKESACNSGDPGLIPGSGRSPGEGNGNPFQYSYLENPMDRGAWQATVHGVAESDTT